MRNVLPADKSLLKNNEFDIIRCNTLKECNSLRSNASGNNCQCFQEIPRKQKLLIHLSQLQNTKHWCPLKLIYLATVSLVNLLEGFTQSQESSQVKHYHDYFHYLTLKHPNYFVLVQIVLDVDDHNFVPFAFLQFQPEKLF
mgnify:CR=1 FL=1